jgi:hypothetical protein
MKDKRVDFGNKPWKPPELKEFTARDVADSYVEGFKDGYMQARQDLMENQRQGPDESPEVG